MPEVAITETTRIGVILPLTGPLANVGRDIQDAILLKDEASLFHFEDDGFEPRNTVSAVQKLLSDPSIRGIITFGSGTTLAAKPILKRSKLPVLAIAMSDMVVDEGSNIFRYYLPVKAQAERINLEIKQRGYENVVFVASQQEAMLDFVGHFKNHFGIPPDKFIEVIPGDTDLRGVALRIANREPDGICLLLGPPELSSFPQQMRGIGYSGRFFGAAQVGNPDAIEAANGTLEGAWFTTINDSFASTFHKRFLERFQRDPIQEAFKGYDAAGLLINAIDTSDPVEALKSVSDYNGLFANNLGFESPNTFLPPLKVKRVRGNSWVSDN